MALVKLALADEAGRVLSENFYWHAPQAAGYRGLNDLPAAEATLRVEVKGWNVRAASAPVEAGR